MRDQEGGFPASSQRFCFSFTRYLAGTDEHCLQTEKYLEENEEAAKEQKKKLDRLSGKSVEENERD